MEPLEPAKPAPPRPEWLKPAPSAPANPALTPMMDFFQKRMEAMERELSLERERAQAATSLLAQQESLKNEVESHLKSLSDQLKREKSERDGEEARVHARGRIESLEKRLDEMNATFAQLLKEAVARRESEGPSSAALAAELAAFRAALKDSVDGVARWKGELRDLAALIPKVEGLTEGLTERLPKDEKLFAESVGRRLDEFGQRVARSLEDWRRAQDLEHKRLGERLEAMARERDELGRLWDEQSRTLREEQFKDRLSRESEVARQISTLAARLETLSGEHQTSAQDALSVKEAVLRTLQILTATPKAKDALIAELEGEKEELRRALADRQESLRRFAGERRDVEKSLGDSLVRLTSELEDERARTRASDARAASGLGEIETLKARLADAERAIKDRDERLLAANGERDELAKSLVSEAEKVRRAEQERRSTDEESEARAALLRKHLEEESMRRAISESSAGDARSRMAALADQVARAAQDRDTIVARFSEWEAERQRLLETLRKKDEMLSLLSSTFQGVLKKNP